MKAQIKAIIASAVVIVLCLSAIGGVTYSWFSDTESSNININTAHINIGITSIEKGTVTGYGDAEINQDTHAIIINNLAANCTIPLTFKMSNNSSIDIIYVLKTTITNYGSLDDDTKDHVRINGDALDSSKITQVGSTINPATTEFTIPVTISSDSLYGNDVDIQSPRSIMMKFDVTAYQGDYPTNTLVGGEAKIPSNKIIQGDAYKDPSDTNAKDVETIVDLSTITNVNGTVGVTETTVDVSNLSIKVESKSDNNGYDTGVGTIGLTLFNGSEVVKGANFGSEKVTITATIKNVMSDPGIIQVLYKTIDEESIEHIEYIETTSCVYDSINKTLTVIFKTSHFSDFTVVSAVAEIEGRYYASLKDAIDSITPSVGELLPEQTIMILSDIENACGIAVKGGKHFTIDFNDHTYTVDKPGAGSSGTETNAFQFLKGSTITLKNGTINISNNNTDIIRVIQNYSNLTLDNIVIDATNQYRYKDYVMSFNEGNSIIRNSQIIISNPNDVAFDSDGDWGGYSATHTLVIENSTIGGKIEMGRLDGYAITINNSTYTGLSFASSSKYSGVFLVDGKIIASNNTTVIEDLDGLKAFAYDVNINGNTYSNKVVILVSNIDLCGELWTPIGLNADDSKKFKGLFDGYNNIISNLKIDTEDGYTAAGFFGALNGTVQNLIIEGAQIKHISAGNASGQTDNGIAVIAGSIYESGTIKNVKVIGTESDPIIVEGNRLLGGIAGYVYGSIINCSVEHIKIIASPDKLTGIIDNADKAGGIAGSIWKNSNNKIEGCTATSVYIQGYRDVGGIAGFSSAPINNCTVSDAKLVQNLYDFTEENTNFNNICGRSDGTNWNNTTNNISSNVTITLKQLSNESE